jgi:hypothetical protein
MNEYYIGLFGYIGDSETRKIILFFKGEADIQNFIF